MNAFKTFVGTAAILYYSSVDTQNVKLCKNVIRKSVEPRFRYDLIVPTLLKQRSMMSYILMEWPTLKHGRINISRTNSLCKSTPLYRVIILDGKLDCWLNSDTLGSWWGATVAAYCTFRMTEHPKLKSTGRFFSFQNGHPVVLQLDHQTQGIVTSVSRKLSVNNVSIRG